MFIKRNAVTELTGPYGEGTLSLVSPNCVHSPTQRPSTQAGVSQPAAPCPSSALSQEPWTHRHSSFPSCTLYRSHSRETWGLGGGQSVWNLKSMPCYLCLKHKENDSPKDRKLKQFWIASGLKPYFFSFHILCFLIRHKLSPH